MGEAQSNLEEGGGGGDADRILIRKTEGKKELGNLGLFEKIIWNVSSRNNLEGVDWVDQVQDCDMWLVLVKSREGFAFS